MKKSFVFIFTSLVIASTACTANPDGTNTDTTTTTSSTTTSSSNSGGAGGDGGQGGSAPTLNCDNVASGEFVAKFLVVGTKPDGEDYLAADGFQFGDQPGTWPKKYLGTDPAAMSAEINFGIVGPTWFVKLSWGLTNDPDPNKPGMAADYWTCNPNGPDWGCGVDLARYYIGCHGHNTVNSDGDGAVVSYTIQ